MASVLSAGRRPSDPTLLEIEARKAELHARRQAVVDELVATHALLVADCYDEARITGADPFRLIIEANTSLQERDEPEPLDMDHARDPRQVEQWIPVPKVEPREMTKEDICNVDIGSLAVLNRIAGYDDTERYSLGSVDPDAGAISDDQKAEWLEANDHAIPMVLKTEMYRRRDVRSFRSKRK